MSFSTINSMSISVNSSNFTNAFSKVAFHTNLGAQRRFAGSKWAIFDNVFLKFSKTSAKSNVSLLRYNVFISKSLQVLFPCI